MNLQSFAEHLLWISAVATAGITVVISLIFALDIARDGFAPKVAGRR